MAWQDSCKLLKTLPGWKSWWRDTFGHALTLPVFVKPGQAHRSEGTWSIWGYIYIYVNLGPNLVFEIIRIVLSILSRLDVSDRILQSCRFCSQAPNWYVFDLKETDFWERMPLEDCLESISEYLSPWRIAQNQILSTWLPGGLLRINSRYLAPCRIAEHEILESSFNIEGTRRSILSW